jgi:nucleoside-diphosphate-sugar epimerase
VIAQTRDIHNKELKKISNEQVSMVDVFDLKIDFLIHNLSITKYFGDWNEFEVTNINLSKKLFKHFKNIKSVYISSISVFGYKQEEVLIDENSKRLDINDKNIDMYSKSKIIVEDFIKSNIQNCSIIRPGLIYGNRVKSNSRQILSKYTTIPLVEINGLCKVIEKCLQNPDQLIINAVDNEADLRIEYEKENPNLIILPNFVFLVAKTLFKNPLKVHQICMMNRKNRYNNSLYTKVLNEL